MLKCFLVLADFGQAELIPKVNNSEEPEFYSVLHYGKKGKCYYYPPEYFNSNLPHINCFKVDIWALVTLLLLLLLLLLLIVIVIIDC